MKERSALCFEQAALQRCLAVFWMMLEQENWSPQGFIPTREARCGAEGAGMAQGAWAGIRPVGTCARDQDRFSSWAERFLNRLEVSNYYFFFL